MKLSFLRKITSLFNYATPRPPQSTPAPAPASRSDAEKRPLPYHRLDLVGNLLQADRQPLRSQHLDVNRKAKLVVRDAESCEKLLDLVEQMQAMKGIQARAE